MGPGSPKTPSAASRRRSPGNWPNGRPDLLDPIYPVLFVDAVVVKVRDGQVRNTPFYFVMGVTVNGERRSWASGPATAPRVPGSGCRSSPS